MLCPDIPVVDLAKGAFDSEASYLLQTLLDRHGESAKSLFEYCDDWVILDQRTRRRLAADFEPGTIFSVVRVKDRPEVMAVGTGGGRCMMFALALAIAIRTPPRLLDATDCSIAFLELAKRAKDLGEAMRGF